MMRLVAMHALTGWPIARGKLEGLALGHLACGKVVRK